jgi:hypothetical protein
VRLHNLGQVKKEREVNTLPKRERRGQEDTRAVFRLLPFSPAKISKNAIVGDAQLINACRESDSRSVLRVRGIYTNLSTESW